VKLNDKIGPYFERISCLSVIALEDFHINGVFDLIRFYIMERSV
jgi:hypothetical protein